MSFFKRKQKESDSKAAQQSEKNKVVPAGPPPTPLQLLVKDEENAPIRLDGSDKYFGMENVVKNNLADEYEFANTCYCNSIMQCLYYSKPFRENVVNFPRRAIFPGQPLPTTKSAPTDDSSSAVQANGANGLPRINTDLIGVSNPKQKTPLSPSNAGAGAPRKSSLSSPYPPGLIGPNENKDSPEVKKRLVLATNPVLRLEQGNETAYGMKESLFTAMKDMFETIMSSETRTGVVSPQRIVDVVKRENEMFRSTMHQDAHEFLNYVLNEVVENVEAHSRKVQAEEQAAAAKAQTNGTPTNGGDMTPKSSTSSSTTLNTGWIHSLFEGQLSSETKCLTCETISRRNEAFLDLSIDLEKHTSITSCLRQFSASEMLCERNKFHCDNCGGLQEAEKRMKIKRLPRILALHLKRFKYTEDMMRHQKLFHRVVYPYYLRLFNTTDDCTDPDRLYELYAVVVHIGGGPYHGHYVAIVKTETKGWLLFDDELVEPVDKSFVKNFFGGEKQGLAAAYVLFYQETTQEKMRAEMDEEAAAEAAAAEAKAAGTATVVGGDAEIVGGLGHAPGNAPTPSFHTEPVAATSPDSGLDQQTPTPTPIKPVPSAPSSIPVASTPVSPAAGVGMEVPTRTQTAPALGSSSTPAATTTTTSALGGIGFKRRGGGGDKDKDKKEKEKEEGGGGGTFGKFSSRGMGMGMGMGIKWGRHGKEKDKEKEGKRVVSNGISQHAVNGHGGSVANGSGSGSTTASTGLSTTNNNTTAIEDSHTPTTPTLTAAPAPTQSHTQGKSSTPPPPPPPPKDPPFSSSSTTTNHHSPPSIPTPSTSSLAASIPRSATTGTGGTGDAGVGGTGTGGEKKEKKKRGLWLKRKASVVLGGGG